jgi:hypothetical protein
MGCPAGPVLIEVAIDKKGGTSLITYSAISRLLGYNDYLANIKARGLHMVK